MKEKLQEEVGNSCMMLGYFDIFSTALGVIINCVLASVETWTLPAVPAHCSLVPRAVDSGRGQGYDRAAVASFVRASGVNER